MPRPALAPTFETRSAIAAPRRERREASLELRSVNIQERIIEGYASVFNVVDSYGSVIDPGAFNRTLASPVPGGVTCYIGHESNRIPVGLPVEMRADGTGLFTRTEIAPTTEGDDLLAAAAWLLERGRPLGISIGFYTEDDKRDTLGSQSIRRIMDLSLWEYSYVGIPSCNPARVSGVRSQDGFDEPVELIAGELLSVGDGDQDAALRTLLREAGAMALEHRAGRVMSQKNLDRLHTVIDALASVHGGTCDMADGCPQAAQRASQTPETRSAGAEAAPANDAEPAAAETEHPEAAARAAEPAESADTSIEAPTAEAGTDAGADEAAAHDAALRAAFARLDGYLIFAGPVPEPAAAAA